MIIRTWSAVVKDFGSLRLIWAPDHIHVSIATYKAFLRYIKVHHKYESQPSSSAWQFSAQCQSRIWSKSQMFSSDQSDVCDNQDTECGGKGLWFISSRLGTRSYSCFNCHTQGIFVCIRVHHTYESRACPSVRQFSARCRPRIWSKGQSGAQPTL